MSDFEGKLQEAMDILKDKPLIREIHGDAIVAGDIHGDIDSLNKIIELREEKDVKNLLLLGDYVDRGDHQIEVVKKIAEQIIEDENFVALRGNHEDSQICTRYGFKSIVERENLDFHQIMEFFSHFPVIAKSDTIFGAHGGIPVPSETSTKSNANYTANATVPMNENNKINEDTAFKINSLEIERTKTIDDPKLLQILWNDPIKTEDRWNMVKTSSMRGPGVYEFGKPISKQFLEDHNLTKILRAHSFIPHGYEWFHDDLVLSLFSASSGKKYSSVERKVAELDLDKATDVEIISIE